MRLVQLKRSGQRRIGQVTTDTLRLLDPCWPNIYSLALDAIDRNITLTAVAESAITSGSFPYDPIYQNSSDWQILPPFDHPTDPAHCLVSGTGLTHKASAENRAAMHNESSDAALTDSAKMYRMGLEAGSPPAGEIGVQPEWFYKGDGTIIRAHGEPLSIPSFAWDGGEEPEIVGIYLISPAGVPFRVGLTIGNEFSDHSMEKKNYLYLAPSKLRNCSIGPELTIGNETAFDHISGTVAILRRNSTLWTKQIWSGQKNMSHSLANLEHHHFKYATHRRPGDVHIHFFGADAFSFGDSLTLASGDIMEVSFPPFGRALRNPLEIEAKPEPLIRVQTL